MVRVPVAVCIVSYNSARHIQRCLESVAVLDPGPEELVVVDCASHDETESLVRRQLEGLEHGRWIALDDNIGFAGGMNRAIAGTRAPYVVSLNPDARPAADFLARLLEPLAAEKAYPIGAVAGRLRRFTEHDRPTLDAAGMYLSLTWRHFDRGSGEEDRGQFMKPERVFGATGAASLFSRAALADVAIDGEAFASEFHSYREDAELCFRLQERGWAVVYEPRALAFHERSNVPARRRSMPAAVNFHSTKNRYLLRAYHQTPSNLLLTAVPTLLRDAAIFLYVLVVERSSLAAYRWLWQNRRQILKRRRRIQERRTAPAWAVNRWFVRRGVAS